MSSVRSFIRTALQRLIWLIVAVLVALGAGGIVAATDHSPGTPARAELTWPGDRAARPALAAAEGSLVELGRAVEALGMSGRVALTQLVAQDADGLDVAIADGTATLARIEALVTKLAGELDAVPFIGEPDEPIRLSVDTRDRYDAIFEAFTLTDDLAGDWRLLTQGALDANRLSLLLAEHDRLAAEAAREGSRERYGPALVLLVDAAERLDEAATLRDRLAQSVDVSTLTRWIDLNRAYDKALRTLYDTLIETNGRPTQAVRDAFAAESAARRRLPGDTRALVVIMSDVARGGMNQAVIAIEDARGGLATAITALGGIGGTGGLDAAPAP